MAQKVKAKPAKKKAVGAKTRPRGLVQVALTQDSLHSASSVLDLVARLAASHKSNRAILMVALHGEYEDSVELDDIGFGDPMRRLTLIQDLTISGVPVDPVLVDRAKTVGEVRSHMNHVMPGWNP